MKRAGKTPRGGNRLHARIGNPSSGGGAAEGKFFHFKGLVEKSFTDVGFAGGLAIFRPAGLLGTGHTPALVDWLLPNIDRMVPARFRCIHIQKLAYAMASVAVDATRTAPGGSARKVTIFEGENLFALLSGNRCRGDLADEPQDRGDGGSRFP